MHNRMDRIDSLIFNYGSTNRTDIRSIEPEELAKIYLNPKIATKTSRVKNKQTFIDRVNKEQDEIVPNEYEQVRSTRARIVMAPAVNIENISDLDVRQILIKDMYTSSTQRAYDYEPIWHDMKAPLPARYARANPLALPKSVTQYVSQEWRKESMEWDRRQQRGHCDATKVFWSTP